jgi:hypothetical protein
VSFFRKEVIQLCAGEACSRSAVKTRGVFGFQLLVDWFNIYQTELHIRGSGYGLIITLLGSFSELPLGGRIRGCKACTGFRLRNIFCFGCLSGSFCLLLIIFGCVTKVMTIFTSVASVLVVGPTLVLFSLLQRTFYVACSVNNSQNVTILVLGILSLISCLSNP